MEVNKEFLEKRIQEILKAEKECLAQLNAIIGAKNECLYLLGQLEEPKKEV